jgi:hypothetical protein
MKPFLLRNRYYIKATAPTKSNIEIENGELTMKNLITASVLALGLLASGAIAGNNESGYCGKGATYDRETLTCVDSFGSKTSEVAAFAVGVSPSYVSNGSIGDFIDETVTQRNERSSR